MNKFFIYPTMFLAALGLFVSLITHVGAIFGFRVLLGDPWILNVGAVIVCSPAVLVANALSKDFPRNQFWGATLRGCPTGLQLILYGLFAYVIVNYVLLETQFSKHQQSPLSSIRAVSGHWIFFYYLALCILYSYIEVSNCDPHPRCTNGHFLQGSSKFCPECGIALQDSLDRIN